MGEAIEVGKLTKTKFFYVGSQTNINHTPDIRQRFILSHVTSVIIIIKTDFK
jgi:hypothetical protein